MKVVYHCFGGAHASPTAAAIHLKIIDPCHTPSWNDFKKIPYFDRITNLDHGQMIKIGNDHLGNEVFILARRNSAPEALNLIREITRMAGGDPTEYYFVNCVQLHNPFMVTGGFSSRGLGLVGFGRPLVIFGTRLSFKVLASIVHQTIEFLEKRKIK